LSLGSGSWHIAGGASLELGATNQLIGGLTGEGDLNDVLGTLKIEVKGGRTDAFGGGVSGSGKIVKSGYGVLALNYAGSALGSLDVLEGSLIIGETAAYSSASLTLSDGPLIVSDGALLGGHGHLAGWTVIKEGGTLSPGNSYGTYSTDRLTLEPGSVFDVEVDPQTAGAGDKVVVAGAAELAGYLVHTAAAGTVASDYLGGREWLILDAASLSGEFGGACSTLLALKPELRYDSSNADVYLSFSASGALSSLAGLGSTPNQRAAAGALAGLSPDSALFAIVAEHATLGNIGGVLEQLSGSAHASAAAWLSGAQFGASRDILRHAYASALSWSDPGFAPSAGEGGGWRSRVWVSAGASRGVLRASENFAKSTFQGPEASLGYDFSLDSGFMGGLVLSWSDKTLKSPAVGSKLDMKGLGLSLWLGRVLSLGGGDLRLVAGGGFMRHSVDSERRIAIGAYAETLTANYSALTWQAFLEASFGFAAGAARLEPYLTLGWTGLKADGFSERGGAAALTAGPQRQDNAFTQLGLRAAVPAGERVSISLDLGWKHLYGGLESSRGFAFQAGSPEFLAKGASPSRDEFTFALGVGFKASDSATISLSYDGSLGRRGRTHAGSARLSYTW
jgi:outer membrane autotransporter protein